MSEYIKQVLRHNDALMEIYCRRASKEDQICMIRSFRNELAVLSAGFKSESLIALVAEELAKYDAKLEALGALEEN